MKRKLLGICFLMAVLVCILCYPTYVSDGSSESITVRFTSPVVMKFSSPSLLVTPAEKQGFSEEMDQLYGRMQEEKTNLPIGDSKIIEALLLQAASVTEEDREKIHQELARYGVFEMPTTATKGSETSVNHGDGKEDVTVNVPGIYYRAEDFTWYITTGGYWNSKKYEDRFLILDLNVGDLDEFGVDFTESGQYDSLVLDSFALLGDREEEEKTVVTYNRSDGDGGKGFSFQLQDKYIRRGIASYSYLGDRWAGVCRYDSDFADFSGVMTSYYVHTYTVLKIQLTTVK